MPPTRPERYNAKARKSGTGAGSHKKKKRKGPKGIPDEEADPNAEFLEHKTAEEKEASRREVLKRELLDPSHSISSKKKRRLEKYIDKQLRKEERVEILQRLAETQAQITSNLHLQSSSTLGTGQLQTAEERNAREEDVAVKQALRKTQRGRHKRIYDFEGDISDSDSNGSEDEQHSSLTPLNGSRKNLPIVVSEDAKMTSVEPRAVSSHSIVIGGALKRNEDGTVTTPVMKPRKVKTAYGTKFASWKGIPRISHTVGSDESDFDSSDSANDTDNQAQTAEQSEAEDEDSDGDSRDKASMGRVANAQKSSFKDWAMGQIRDLRNAETEDSKAYTNIEAAKEAQATLGPALKKRKLDDDQPRGPMGVKIQLPETLFAKAVQKEQSSAGYAKRNAVKVTRSEDVRVARLQLPIVSEEQRILEAILLHPVVVICGETGSGKTTQVPQFLFEAGFGSPGTGERCIIPVSTPAHSLIDNPGMIGITQPRRVAAVSMASRVAYELALPSSVVSYQIRYDATMSPTTSIKFMTDGVLLREMSTDFLLSRYSIVIVDEAHERNLNTDILIGTLSRVIRLREQMWGEGKGIRPLRLVIMSATLRVSDFIHNKALFDVPPPIIEIEARQYPVTAHFDRKTRPDYITQAIRKATKIHTRLPQGGILMFLTGQQEITSVCKKLQSKFGPNVINEKSAAKTSRNLPRLPKLFPEDDEVGSKLERFNLVNGDMETEDIELGESHADLTPETGKEDDMNDDEALDTESDGEGDNHEEVLDEDPEVPMHVVPLYSLLPSQKQLRVFEEPPPGTRLVVVATNVAETSLTIPGIRYVIDCGRAKERRYDPASGIQTFQVAWISKASAAQRAGRAGRTGPGHCYRLYSSSFFEHYFEQFSKPEILRTPIEGIILQMKNIHIDTVINFPFPTPPDRMSLKKAEQVLVRLGALQGDKGQSQNPITALGRTMALFPVEPRFSKMLASGMQHGCLPYVIAMVAALSVGDPFLLEENIDIGDSYDMETNEEDAQRVAHIRSDQLREREKRKATRKAFFNAHQLHGKLGNGQSDVFRILSVVGAYEFAGGSIEFCRKHFVRPKAMEETHKLRSQLSSIVSTAIPSADPDFSPKLPPPSSLQLKVLRQLLTAGFIDQIAVRKDIIDTQSSSGSKFASSRGIEYRAIDVEEDVFIHPSSVLFNQSPPDYVAFREIVRGSKVWIKTLTVVNPSWLAPLGPSMCTFSKPIPIPPTIKDMKPNEVLVIPKFGPGWELPPMRKIA
ncbi:putative ATP-dependent RNA helicase DHR1 [Serendipita sp. 411]|nr:putative ATP-dependent RNA helicase DHR1 [Serendipita sp. 411]